MVIIIPVHRTHLAPFLPSLYFRFEEFHRLERLGPFLPALLSELPSYDVLLTEFVLDLCGNRPCLDAGCSLGSYGSGPWSKTSRDLGLDALRASYARRPGAAWTSRGDTEWLPAITTRNTLVG